MLILLPTNFSASSLERQASLQSKILDTQRRSLISQETASF